MKQLELLHSDSTYFGNEIERANRNFVKIESAIRTLESKYSHDKGWYPSFERLSRVVPLATTGDFAYVKDEFFYWTSKGWKSSGIKASASITGDLYPHLDATLPVYYRGDSIKVLVGSIDDFAGASKFEANVFIKSSSVVKAVFPNQQNFLDIRQNCQKNELYFIIPSAITREMSLGIQTLELAGWFSTGKVGEEYVKRTRCEIFDLQEFETIK